MKTEPVESYMTEKDLEWIIESGQLENVFMPNWEPVPDCEQHPFVLARMGKIQDLTDKDLEAYDFSTR